jgi:hypothetical protein
LVSKADIVGNTFNLWVTKTAFYLNWGIEAGEFRLAYLEAALGTPRLAKR